MSIRKLTPITKPRKMIQVEEKPSKANGDCKDNLTQVDIWPCENIEMIQNSICYHIALLKQNLFDKSQANSLKRRARRLSRQDLIDKINRFCIELDNQKDKIVRCITDQACILDINKWSSDLDHHKHPEIHLFLDLMMEHCFHMIEWANRPYTALTADRNILRKEFKPIDFSHFKLKPENDYEETEGDEIIPEIQNSDLKEISSALVQNEEYESRNVVLTQLADRIDNTNWRIDLPEFKNLEFKKSFHAKRLSAMIKFNVTRNTLVLNTESLIERYGCE